MGFLSVFACLLCVGFATANLGHGFLPGQEYHFEWLGRLTSGIPDLAPQLAGATSKSHVVIVPQDLTHLLVKVIKVEHGEFNEKFDFIPYNEELPVNYQTLTPEQNKFITQPFMIKVENGQVTYMQVDPEEPYWLINGRKAFLNFFNINIYGGKFYEEISNNNIPYNNYNKEYVKNPFYYYNFYKNMNKMFYYKDSTTPMQYSVVEEGITGKCETTYSITPVAEYMLNKNREFHFHNIEHPEKHLIITKTVNYDKCSKLPTWVHKSTGYEHCQNGNSHCNSKHSRTSTTFYLVEGDIHNFIVKYAVNNGKFLFKPVGLTKEQEFDITSHQVFKLIDMKQASSNYNVPNNLKTITNFVYEFPEQAYQANSLFESPIRHLFQFLGHDFGTTIVNDIYKNINVLDSEQINKPAYTQSLVYSLQNLNLNEIKLLWEKISGQQLEIDNYVSSQHITPWEKVGLTKSITKKHITRTSYDPQTENKLKMMVNLLSMTGTNPSIVFLNNLMFNGELKGEQAAQVLMVYPVTINTPTPELVKEIVELLRSEHVKDDEVLVGAGMLAVSHIVHDYCVNDKTRYSSYPSSEFFLHCHPQHSLVLNEVLPFFTHVKPTRYLNLHKIMALGNLGVPEVIPYLKPYIYGYNLYDITLRQQAVYALKTVAKFYPQLVVDVLLPVYKNVVDTYEVRQAAVTVILTSNPPFAVFQQIASFSWFEPSHQIQSYVYTFLYSLSHNQYQTPFFTELKQKANLVLPLTKYVKYGYLYSHFNLFSKMFNEINEGVLVTKEVFGGQHTFMPTKFYMNFKQLFGQTEYTGAEFKFFLDGFIQHIEYMFGFKTNPMYQNTDTAFWFKLFNGMERFITYEKMLKMFNIEQGNAYNSFVDKLNNGFNIDYVKVLPGMDFMMVIPTDLGLPVYINTHFPKYMSLKGKLIGDLKSTGNKHLALDVFKHFEYEFHFNAFIISPLTHKMIGAGIKTHTKVQFPLKMNFEYNDIKKGFHFMLTTPQKEVDIFRTVTLPFTFIKQFDFKPFYFNENEYNVIKTHQHIQQNEMSFGKQLFGLTFKGGYKSDRPGFSFGSFLKSFYNHNLASVLSTFYVPTSWHYHQYYLTFYPQESTTSSIRTNVQYTTEPNTMKVNLKFDGQQPHVYNFVLQHTTDPLNLYEKNFTFKVLQTHPSSQPHEFYLQYTLQYPEIDILKPNVDMTTKGNVQITYGDTSSQKKNIHLRFKMEQTPEQKTFAKNSIEYKRCANEHNHQEYSYNCLAYFLHQTYFNKYTFETVYSENDIPYYVYNYLNTLYDYFNYYYNSYATTTYTHTQQPGHFTFAFERLPNYNTWDVKFVTPNKQVYYYQVPQLQFIEYIFPTYVKHPLTHLAYDQYYGYYTIPYCMIQDKYLTTFDNFTYTLNDVKSECWRVMFTKCYDTTSKFALMQRQHGGAHELRVFFDDHNEVMLTPSSGNNVKVMFNGAEQVLPTNNYKTFTLNTIEGEVIVHAARVGTTLTSLDFTNYNFVVYHDGKNVWVEVGKFFKDKICGTCGNFNGEIYDDFYTSHTCIHESRKEFLDSWIYPNGVCSTPKIHNKKQCHMPRIIPTVEALYHVEGSFKEEYECKVMTQQVKYFKNKMCVSIQKLPYCKQQCSAIFPTIKKVPYYCSTMNTDIKNIADQVHSGNFVDLSKYPFSYLDVSYPELCLLH